MALDVPGRQAQWLLRKDRHPLVLLTRDHIETYLSSLDSETEAPTVESETVGAEAEAEAEPVVKATSGII
jgi:hypothetical protein